MRIVRAGQDAVGQPAYRVDPHSSDQDPEVRAEIEAALRANGTSVKEFLAELRQKAVLT